MTESPDQVQAENQNVFKQRLQAFADKFNSSQKTYVFDELVSEEDESEECWDEEDEASSGEAAAMNLQRICHSFK